jgi:hypothetical protein
MKPARSNLRAISLGLGGKNRRLEFHLYLDSLEIEWFSAEHGSDLGSLALNVIAIHWKPLALIEQKFDNRCQSLFDHLERLFSSLSKGMRNRHGRDMPEPDLEFVGIAV